MILQKYNTFSVSPKGHPSFNCIYLLKHMTNFTVCEVAITSVMGGCAVPSVITNSAKQNGMHNRTECAFRENIFTRLLVLFKFSVKFK
jgi:hypothetical protein